MAAIAERVPAHVIGDGTRTVERAGRAHQRRPAPRCRPREGAHPHRGRRRRDRAGRASRATRSTDVPAEGEMVKLALTGNMSTGGISIDRTFEAHPDNVEIAEEAARVVGLDIAGIDFICPDITEPVRETGGAICEVNAAPGFRMHTHPTIGEPQYVAKPVVDLLFPPGAPSRIPIVAVTGTNGKTTTVRMISAHLQGHGPQGRHDLHRRRRHRRAAGDQVPTPPARSRRGWCCRTRGSTSRSSRSPAAASCARGSATSATTSPSCSTCSPTTSACAASTPSSSSPRSSRCSSRRCRATGTPCSTPTTRWCAGCAALLGRGRLVLDGGARHRGPRLIDAHCRRGGKAVVLNPASSAS